MPLGRARGWLAVPLPPRYARRTLSSAGRHLLLRAASVAAAGLLLFVFDRTVLRAGTAALDAPGHVALWSAQTTVALALGLLGALWFALVRGAGRLRKPRAERGPAWLAGALLALAGAAPIVVVASSLVAGDWIAKQRFAKAIQGGFIATGVIGLFVLGWLYARTEPAGPGAEPAKTPTSGDAEPAKAPPSGDAEPAKAPTSGDAEPAKEVAASAVKASAAPNWKRFLLPVILLVGAVGAAVADAVVLPGLYASLHLFLYGASALLLLLAGSRFADLLLSKPKARTVAGLAGAAVVVVALVLAAILVPGKRSALSVGSRTAGLVFPSFSAPSRVVAEELAAMDLRADAARKKRDTTAAVDKLLGGRRDYNVLLVIVDTLRADTLPPHRGAGQPFATDADTPFLNEWLAGSFRFEHAYSQASRTRRSLPPTFRGLEANEDTERMGVALGTQASALGLVPAAVVPQYFLLPESESAQHLLIGFDRAAFYEKDHQEVMASRVHDMFEGLKGQRFFAWVHFYNMHDPYFADRLTSGADGSVAQRYQKALRWLDGQMKLLVAEVEAAGFAKDTVIFFTADHGENVGLEGGRTGHGGTVNEPEVRVPLAVRIPGQAGRAVDTVAGNVDIVPTVFDIVGAPPSANHRGRSLLPILAGADDETVPLYFENSSGEAQGVCVGAQKLTHAGSGNLFHRYDLAADPGEKRDLYESAGEVDRGLRRAMLRKNPSLFASEMADPAVRAQLVARLAEVGPAAQAGPSLQLLLRLAALSKEKAALEQGQRIFREAKDIDVQLLAVRGLFDTDAPQWTVLLAGRLRKLAGTPDERRLVEGLALNGQGMFAPEVLAPRIHELVTEPPEAWAPWLALVRGWKKSQALFAEPLEALVRAFPEEGPRTAERTRTLVLLLECAGSLVPPADVAAARILAIAVRPWLDDADPKVAVVAARALGKLRDAESAALLRAKMEEGSLDVRIRQAILYALTDLEGKGATALVVAQGKNPLLTVDACQILAILKDPEALPFLRNIVATHYNAYTRGEATKAIKAIEGARKGGPPPGGTGTATASKSRPKLTLPKKAP